MNAFDSNSLLAPRAPRAPRAALSPEPLVSCLTVTQPGRERFLQRAVGDFFRQRYAHRELVLLHDGDDAWHRACETIIDAARAVNATSREVSCRLVRVPMREDSDALQSARESLGALRNRAVAAAQGELVCQWDDDDRYHPARLSAQVEALLATNASACYLEQQIHRFADSGEWLVEDWSRQPYPRNLVQGSALVRRDALPRYPARARGEDTALLHALVAANEPITRIHDAPWLYCYSFHGGNTFDRMHHALIGRDTQLSAAALLNVRSALERELTAYDPPIGL